MDDRQIEDLLRKVWDPKPPSGLKGKALKGAQPCAEGASRVNRLAMRACLALVGTAVAAALVLGFVRFSATSRTPAPRSPGASNGVCRETYRENLPAPEKKVTNASRALDAKKRPHSRVAVKPTRERRVTTRPMPDTAAGARVSYVDADEFDAASDTANGNTSLPEHVTGHAYPEADDQAWRDTKLAYRPRGETEREPMGLDVRMRRGLEDTR
ncbi:MAG: hypothetical protein Q7T82_08855 [Armatimonadota bacterium]|nr:hypothetical protein [Armatimonadota bacterium]